ncbi:Hydrogen peroxide-inducible genes activator [Beijerinckiaceae bacterium RH AL1]|nr:Hydrogen peroxide-inducible genes activator [Beijerinckiaceae bacterium RH CH11]VVB45556.1 Hydrogen peroxide-inducible genes activator [Beijerinckiaceae bacterium RH AL8]VVC54886.1 Hydrogen peroxide-inducible genes activator [Beijerinckiaceae bacterium RH AL1]
MNLRDLRYIIAVADHGHFGRAAQSCAVSQPTLSGQILKLEKELGVDLFERVGKSVTLTAAGTTIVAHARRAVTAADDVVATAATLRDPEAAPLRLGIIPTLAPYLMPLILPEIAATMPRLQLTLVEDLTDRLVELLVRNQLDAVLIASEPDEAGLQDKKLFDEPFWLVMRDTHPLAASDVVRAEQIPAGSMMLLQDGHCLRDQALDLCQRPAGEAGVMADMRASSLDTLLQMADAGFGLTLMPHLAVVRDVPLPRHLVARRLAGPHASRRVRLVCRSGSARRATIDRLTDVVRACTRPMSGEAPGIP